MTPFADIAAAVGIAKNALEHQARQAEVDGMRIGLSQAATSIFSKQLLEIAKLAERGQKILAEMAEEQRQ